MNTLREIIYEIIREGELYEKLDRSWVRWAPAFQGQITARPFVPHAHPRPDLLVLP